MRVPAAVLVFAFTLPATAQERDPSSRQVLVDLSYVLGQAHALRQACLPGDQKWRSRMIAMVETEAADHAFADRLRGQFNTGYVAAQSQYPGCSPASRRAETEVEAKGAQLARRLGQARAPGPAPSSEDEPD